MLALVVIVVVLLLLLRLHLAAFPVSAVGVAAAIAGVVLWAPLALEPFSCLFGHLKHLEN